MPFLGKSGLSISVRITPRHFDKMIGEIQVKKKKQAHKSHLNIKTSLTFWYTSL